MVRDETILLVEDNADDAYEGTLLLLLLYEGGLKKKARRKAGGSVRSMQTQCSDTGVTYRGGLLRTLLYVP
jgi:hypothetical protein